MKIRNAFVANSSSSSFIVVKHKPTDEKEIQQYIYGFNYIWLQLEKDKYEKLTIPIEITLYGESLPLGETNFTRQNSTYKDFYSKLNFALILLRDWTNVNGINIFNTKEFKWIDSLIKKLFKCKNVEYNILFDVDLYTIDHQSINEKNYNKIFADKKTLYQFLLSSKNYVKMGDDNEDE